MKWLTKRLTYANVMSSLAVFLILGGATAFAATQLGKNSVGAAQLKAGAVTGAKIHARAVTGAKIADGSITGSDIASDSVTGSDIKLNTLPPVPKAESVAGQESFSFFGPEPVEKVIETVGPLRVVAACGGALGHSSFIDLLSDGPALVQKVGSSDPPVQIGPGRQGTELLRDNGSAPGIVTDDGEWLILTEAPAPDGSVSSFSFSHVALGLDVPGHTGECFFSGAVEKLSQ